MPTQKTLFFLFSTLVLSLWGAQEGWAVRPLSANIALVAGGEGRPGFKDGSFTSALFNRPLGLAVSEDGTRLYVADSGNNRIRVIHLDQNNEVTTLAGQDGAGKLDGPLTLAQFNHPRGVLCLPGNRLVVNDFGNQLLRLVDLKAGTVTILTGTPSGTATPSIVPAAQVSMKGVRELAYMPMAHSIFFTQPELGALNRLDLKTGLVSTVLEKNTQIPNPAALWCQGNKLYVADKELPQIWEMDWKDNAAANPLAIPTPLGKVLSLSLNGGILYTLLAIPGVPAQRFFLDKQYWDNEYKDGFINQFNGKLVSFRSPWGDTLPPEALFPPGGDISFAPSIGFAPDPSDSRKFYVSKPDYNMVVSFRDLFGFDWNPSEGERNSNGVDEPEYPAQKPKNTYRIIIVGDSRSAEVLNYPFQSDYHSLKRPNGNLEFPHNLSLAPQIERELNFQAALDGVPLNYEVFNCSRHGDYLIWPTYEIPGVVKRNDIDLVVLFMTDHLPYETYFNHPLTSDGIPKFPNDMEFLVKPPLERLPPSGTPRKFYDFCKAHGWVHVRGNGLDFDADVLSNPEVRDSLIELYGKPLEMLNRKLSGMKTSTGQPVRLLLCNTYTGRSWDKQIDMSIWPEAAKKFNFPIWDLNAEMNALNLSFFPLTGDGSHLNPDGATFFGRLLAHDLIRDKLIPFKTKDLGD